MSVRPAEPSRAAPAGDRAEVSAAWRVQGRSRMRSLASISSKVPVGPLLASIAIATAATSFASSEEDVLAKWSSAVWEAALDGREQEVETLLDAVPSSATSESAARLRELVAGREQHESDSDETRRADREKALADLAEQLAAGELTKALTSAVQVQTLSEDWGAALGEERIVDLIRRADETEKAAQAAGDWLLAQEIVFRLRTLHEDVGRTEEYLRYNEELERINRRIGLLAQYAPKALHDLRAMQAKRIAPEEEFPAFNPAFTEDWKEQVRGISQPMLSSALRTVASTHIGNVGWRPLLEGGLDSLEIFATTEALAESFPHLADPARVKAWREAVASCRALIAEIPDGDLTRRHCSRIVGELQLANQRTLELPEPVLFREFGDGSMEAVARQYEDQYSEIIWPERYRRFQQQVEGSFVGVGILIRHDERRDIVVVNPLEGSPAWRGGVKSEDVILEVDGVPTTGWSLNRAVDEITGPAGRPVSLTLKREGAEQPVEVSLVREPIKMRSVNGWWKKDLDDSGEPSWDWWIDRAAGIGYVRLTSFNDESFADFLAAIEEMRSQATLRGLVLDLRHNPGGLLKSAVEFTNLYVSEGKIVTCEDRHGREAMRLEAQRNRSVLADLPTVVLVNQGSASASEIVAGALQAHGAALVLGDRSFGKGSVQEVHDLSDRQAAAVLKITTQLYRLPPAPGEEQGRLVHKQPGAEDWGVNPDIVVKMTPRQIEKSYEVRQLADQITEDGDADAEPRPDVRQLVEGGIDPQLEMAILILQARVLGDLEQVPGTPAAPIAVR